MILQPKGDSPLFPEVLRKGDSPLFYVGSIPRMDRLGNGPYIFFVRIHDVGSIPRMDRINKQ